MNNRKKITFLSFFHSAFDERIWYHQRCSLLERGFTISIISGTINTFYNEEKDVVVFDCNKLNILERIKYVQPFLIKFSPDIIICDTSEAICAALKYKKIKKIKIIYDITERYPSFESLSHKPKCIRWITKYLMLSFDHLMAYKCDAFIFGEYFKSLPYLKKFPKKNYIYSYYYPNLSYLHATKPNTITNKCVLLYAGSTSFDKGFYNVINSAVSVAKLCPKTNFILKVITNNFIEIKKLPSNLIIEYSKYLPFLNFCQEITKADIFFDLRSINKESIYSLPIKIFYYMGCGRPSIYFDNIAIRQHIKIKKDSFHLVNPTENMKIAAIIKNYIDNPQLYKEDCYYALSLAKKTYNWNSIKETFCDFISKI